jgi:hypothetical protein
LSLSFTEVSSKAYTRPYRPVNKNTAHTLTLGATTGTGVSLVSSVAFFDSDQVDSYFKITNSGTTAVFQLTAVTDSTNAVGKFIIDATSATATDDWEEQAWSVFRGWPRTVSFFQSRIVYGGNQAQPDTVWFGSVGNFFELHTGNDVNFAQFTSSTFTNDDSKVFTLASRYLDEIQWLSPGQRLGIGTLGTEYSLDDINTDLPIVQSETSHGSNFSMAERISGMTLFIERNQDTVREYVFDFDTDSFQATDVMLLSEHLPKKRLNDIFDTGLFAATARPNTPGVKQLAYQDSEKILWCIDESGGLFSLARDKQQQIASWQSHEMGGETDLQASFYPDLGGSGGPNTSAAVSSITAVPSTGGSNTGDQVWMCVERNIDGAQTYQIERMAFTFDNDDYNKAFFVDSAVRVVGASSNTFTGFSHLEGETVQVLDMETGKKFTDVVVASGIVTLPNSLETTGIVAGLGFTSSVSTFPLNDGSAIGSAVGENKRIDRCVVRFDESRGANVGREDGTLYPVLMNDNTLANDAKQPTFSGEKEIDFPRGIDTEAIVKIESDGPLPLSILAITTRYKTNEV